MAEKDKKILSGIEWFLLIVALGILALVLLQNKGIYMIETVEKVEITRNKEPQEKEFVPEKNTLRKKEKDSKDHLQNLSEYFSKNREQARSEGKDISFNWNSLKLPNDEKEYLKDKYGENTSDQGNANWIDLISKSHQTYKSVKSVFNELGIDTEKVLNTENASKVISNPLIANSIYQKIEEDFGIPAEKSKSFAEKNRQTLNNWAKFVEEELQKN